MLEHGGNLAEVARTFGRPESQWLDLSTGVNPHPWKTRTPPPHCWSRLPDPDDGLLPAARTYYGADTVVATPGTQAALGLLPFLRTPSRVAVISPGYAEHAAAWKRAGHQVTSISPAAIDAGPDAACDVLVVINPNNPDGSYFPTDTLLAWHRQLSARGGWLVVDEAFIDPTPGYSLAPLCPARGLVLLRSIGKFFGLPGARVGFALGDETILSRLEEALGPWPVNGPGRWATLQALSDEYWQTTMGERLRREGARLRELMRRHFEEAITGTPLFATVTTSRAATVYRRLAHKGVLVRLLDNRDGLRLGLPPDEPAWARLDSALAQAVRPEASA